jgi:toxin secretion/phage lysis holin
MDKWFNYVAAACGAVVSFLYGGTFPMLGVLGMFVLFDYLSGIGAAAKEGKLSSEIGLQGIPKKLGIFMMVAIGYLIDRMLGDGHMVRDAAAMSYTLNELLSIIENAGRIGIPVPPVISQAVAVLQGKGGAAAAPSAESKVSGR